WHTSRYASTAFAYSPIMLGIFGGMAVEAFPSLGAGLPAWIQPLMSSSLVLGTLVAMIANLLLFHWQCELAEKGPNPTKTLLANPSQETSAPLEKFSSERSVSCSAYVILYDKPGPRQLSPTAPR